MLVVGVVVGTTQLAKELAIMVNKCELAESKALEYALLLQVSWITSLLFCSRVIVLFLFSFLFSFVLYRGTVDPGVTESNQGSPS